MAVIDSVTDQVTVENADGTTGQGKPYYLYDAELGGGSLDVQEVSATKTWYFHNPNNLRFSYTVVVLAESGDDQKPPAITITNPLDGAVISNATPWLTAVYQDDGSGIDASSFSASIDGTDVTASFTVTQNQAEYRLSTPLDIGSHTLTVSISDNDGNTATADAVFQVTTSAAELKYLFSVAENDWIFASAGDGSYIEYIKGSDLGLTTFADVVGLSKALVNGPYYFTRADSQGVLQSPADGTQTEHMANAAMGLSADDRILALHKGLDNLDYFALQSEPDIRQTDGSGAFSFFLQNERLGLTDSDALGCLHIGYDNTVYFCNPDSSAVLTSSGNGANSPFLANTDLGVPNYELTAFAIFPETTSPSLTITNPSDGAVIETRTPLIELAFNDGDSGIDLASFRCELNGGDISAQFNLANTGATFQVTSPLPIGSNSLTATIQDNVGNLKTATSNFAVDVLTTSISAVPSSGAIPLNTAFSANVTGGTPPVTYSWDINGDQVEDDNRANFYYIYNTAGTYNVSLTVTDHTGNTATDTTTINALSGPTVQASADPVLGQAPLTVDFSAISNDPDGTIVQYEWDFNGDGVYDYSNSNTPITSSTFNTAGFYTATIRVTDDDGLTASDSVVIQVGNAPTANAAASPLTGTAPLSVDFTGSGDDADGSIVMHEWDFDGDGTFDFSSASNGNTSHTYTSAGIYNAILRVTDDDGLIGATSIRISVSGPPIALPRAFPTSGEAPLEVTFFSNGQDLDGSPEYYDWDFNGDGIRDRRLIASMNTTYTYNQSGTYNATLTVVDNEGLTNSAVVQIQVTESSISQGIPSAQADAIPNNGGAPLETILIGSGTDPDGTITKYEWDWEGDGTYDFEELAAPLQTVGTRLGSSSSYSRPCFADIDSDGDLDAFIGEYYGEVGYFENIGSSTQAKWEDRGKIRLQNDTTIDVGYLSAPAMADIDGDGDLDALIGENNGRVAMYENIGDSTHPIWEDRGFVTDRDNRRIDIGNRSVPNLVDIDGDGDLDAYLNDYLGRIRFYENTGTAAQMQLEDRGSVTDVDGAVIDVGSYGSATLTDLDGDDDLDLLVGHSAGTITYYDNTGSANGPIWTLAQNSLVDVDNAALDIGHYAAPYAADINQDQAPDLFVGTSTGNIVFIQNVGSAAAASFKTINSNYNLSSVANGAYVALGDIDADGDQDMFVGEYQGFINYFENIGTGSSPYYTGRGRVVDSNTNAIVHASFCSPELADIDADGDLDLFVAVSNGRIYFYENTGTELQPEWTNSGSVLRYSNNNIIDLGSYARVSLVDIDGDGDLDILGGDHSGRIHFIENQGTSAAASFVSMGYLVNDASSRIDVGNYSAPEFADIDMDGDLDMLVAEYNGRIHLYNNIGTRQNAIWLNTSDAYLDIDLPYYTNIELADLDNDQDQDMILGNNSGLTYLRWNTGTVIHTYTSPGQYAATLRVTDNDDKTATDTTLINVLQSGAPSVTAIATPTSGDAPLVVSFAGTASDPDGTIVLYEWDYDGDGTYDWSNAQTMASSHTYNTAGTFQAVVRVTDNDGNQATRTLNIQAKLNISTGRTTLFNPVDGEVATITTTLSTDATMSLTIIDIYGDVVRNLLADTVRTAGTYQDAWDGRDDLGNMVRDGVYYYIINYEAGDEQDVLDLRENASYNEATPYRSWPGTFDPFSERLPVSTYTISKPAEVSFYYWTRDYSHSGSSIKPVRTILLREPQRQGTHSVIWDGVDDMGVTVPTGRQYRITLWVYDLADNAIIVTGNRPVITGVDAEPNYFSPAYNPYAQPANEYTLVSFNLSKQANLQVTIRNSDGVVVNSFSVDDKPAGENSIIWDGKDFNQELVKDGAYTIQLTAIDAIGNRSLPFYASVYVFY
jgi:PKD repeat protein